MEINLFRCNDPKEKIVKENKDSVTTLTGSLKSDTSITDPVITVKSDYNQIIQCNFAYIPEFRRYYFITDIKSVRGDLWELTLHVDVLYSFAMPIMQQGVIVGRQENLYNLYLNDEEFKVYQDRAVVTRAFGGGFKSLNFVLAMAGS